VQIPVSIRLEDDGTIHYLGPDNLPLSEEYARLARKQGAVAIEKLITDECDKTNAIHDQLAQIHAATPNPSKRLVYSPKSFDIPAPEAPRPIKPKWWLFWSQSHRSQVQQANQEQEETYRQEYHRWESGRAAHDRAEVSKSKVFETVGKGQAPAAVTIDALERWFFGLEWPRETQLSFELQDDKAELFVDIDLPEVEDMPNKTAQIAGRLQGLKFKTLSESAVRRNYMRHVHGIALRVAGEAIALLPWLNAVVVSGYSQRKDPKTGHERDDYLYSVRIDRERWVNLNHSDVGAIDPVEAITVFELRRSMSKSGVFKTIEPFTPNR
jgi:hypothetical protein